MKFTRGHRMRRWRRRRALARWTPRAVGRRALGRVTAWGLRLMGWSARLALRRVRRAVL
ncbi:hypothetical protein QEZ40_006603 [Streptomyces katrae]|uniref:Uncharacterized protein n=1 Tax=Streptomyces katrae TaxID=68223 RepID=A0ABT7GQN7_9ACTN|nr:hypothetical protein [Streptomyces katrae]MDK9495576.1 hypothetical protein [Streptomyces katrae]